MSLLGLALLLLVTLFGPAASQLFPLITAEQRALLEAIALAPEQAGGSAAGKPHEIAEGPPHQAKPESLQSRYPEIKFPERSDVPRNETKVFTGTAQVRGFDRETSEELPEQRGRQQRTYRNDDGTLTTEFSRDALNYQSAEGEWHAVDPAVEDAGAEGWRNRADSVRTNFARTSDAQRLVHMDFGDGAEFGYGLRGAARATGIVDGTTITYPAALPGSDLKLESVPGGVKETVVLHGPDAARSWSFPLHLKGLTAQVVDNQVVLKDRRGAERATIPAGFMTDSAKDPATSFGVNYSIVDGSLEVEADGAWLRDPARRFPVLVDPSVLELTATDSIVVHGNGRQSGAQDLLVGLNNGVKHASYLNFGDVAGAIRDHKVFGAQLYLTNYSAKSCDPRPITVHAVRSAWGTGGGYPGPAFDPEPLTSSSFAHGYIGDWQPVSSCPTASEVIDLGVRGRDLVQGWVNGQPNHGLTVRASETDSLGWKKFTGHGTANKPRLFVTHSPYDAEYRIDNGVPDPPVHAQSPGKVKITVTNRGAQTWGKDSFVLGYRAYAANGAPFATVESQKLTGDVPRGGSVTLDAQINAMPIGEYILDFSMLRKGGPWFTDEQIPPARLTLRVVNIKPIVKAQYPPNGYSVQTLTPQLWVDAVDVDSPPDKKPQYRFEICEKYVDNNGVGCVVNSGYVNDRVFTVPVGALRWSKSYQWRAFGYDGIAESVELPPSTLLTAVPQPEITSHLANAPYGGANENFDSQTGNYFSSAVDASVAVTGPALDVVRTYNSLDPRKNLIFGAGWSTRYDMRVQPDGDGSGNVVVTYPDGQQVRFGRNADGTFSPPPGRSANFRTEAAESGGGWLLTDKAFTSYRFRVDGRLWKIIDEAGHVVEVEYDGAGNIKRAINRTSDRALEFGWAGGTHVRTVTTDPVDGSPDGIVWTYSYTGDKLDQACGPENHCTKYDYQLGSHYRSVVVDSRPLSYWRLGDPLGTKSESQVRTNLGKDDGVSKDVTPAEGVLNGTSDGSGRFNGSSSVITLPAGMVRKNRDLTVELWFKTSAGGPLFGYQQQPITGVSAGAVPALYVGQDGKLRGQFWNGAANPLTSTRTVNDDQWHHVVLSGSLATQMLYLDGEPVSTTPLAGEINHPDALHSQIGGGYTVPPSAWPGWGTDARRYFSGLIDEVAYYEHPLGPAEVKSHYQARAPSDQLTRLTLPSGRTAAQLRYDLVNDRVSEFTDRDGGLWKISTPVVTGTADNLIRTTRVTDPGNRQHFYDFDPKRGRVLRYAAPLGLGTRPEDARDATGKPSAPPAPTCPAPTSPPPGPGDPPPVYCGGPGTPPNEWIGGPVDGQGVRTFTYDEQGFQSTVTDENGNKVHLTTDERGNLVSRQTCRVAPGDCQTSYSTYYLNTGDVTDPRNDKIVTHRDARSSGATDSRYLTSYAYTGENNQRGLLAQVSKPDGGGITHTYTLLNGGTPAFDGGGAPAGLLATSKDSRGAVTKYSYFRNGDLAQEEVVATGLITQYTYDALGRRTSQKQISDDHPQGLQTTFAYDRLSRRTSVTEPATTNLVTKVKHTLRTETSYDADGRPLEVKVKDVTGGDAERVTTNEYDDRGRLSVRTDAEGAKTFYGYDSFGNRASMTDAGGTKYEYAYTGRNKIAEVRLRAFHDQPVVPGSGTGEGTTSDTPGTTLVLQSFTYDLAGRTTRATDAMGRTKQFIYYNDDLLHKVVAKGVRNPFNAGEPARDVLLEENLYDGAGNPVRQLTPGTDGTGKRVTTSTYDAVGRVRATESDPDGLKRRTEFTYDTQGNTTQVKRTGLSSNSVGIDTSRVEVTDFQYDLAGRMFKRTVVNGPKSLVTQHGYNDRGLLTSVTDPRNNTTNFGYDEHGNQVTVTSPLVQVESNGGDPVAHSPMVTTGLDTFGAPTHIRSPNGQVATTGYDRLGRVVRTESPDYTRPGENTAKKSVQTVKYDGLGNRIEVKDPRDGVTTSRYDQLGRLREVREPAPGGIWSYTYTATGETLSVTDPTGARAQATYDDLGRPVTSTSLERKPQPAAYTTELRYDDAGNLRTVTPPSKSVTQHDYNVLGERIRTTAPDNVTTQFGYDLVGNQVRVSDGLGRTSFAKIDAAGRPVGTYQLNAQQAVLRQTATVYDDAGNVVESRNAEQEATTFAYDAANRLVSQVEPVADNKSITTSFGYDANGQRTRFTDGRLNRFVTTYNSLGLPESTVEPSTPQHPQPADRTWTTSYDLAGNPDLLKAPGGVTRTRMYDALNRMREETGAGAEVATPNRALTYDAAGRLKTTNAPGGTNTFDYNDQGLLLSATGPSGNSSFTYDADGRPLTQTDAAGTTVNSYVDGRLRTVLDGATGRTRVLDYDNAGSLESVAYGAGNTRTYGYNEFGGLASDTLRGGTTTVTATTYEYDLADRVKRKKVVTGASVTDNTYTYDKSGRLKTWAAGSVATAYDWDDSGNRTSAGASTATFDARNRMLSDGSTSYTWSARGTPIKRGDVTYQFDAFDRSVKRGAATYTYDGLDRSVRRNGVAFSYVGKSLNVASDGTTNYSRDLTGSLLSLSRGNDKRTLVADRHGDVVAGFDGGAALTGLADSTTFDPFGKVLASTGTRSSLGFQSDYTDPDSGEVDMGARWYDPAAGAFTSRDDISLPTAPSGGANRFTYGNGDPVGNYDPDGHYCATNGRSWLSPVAACPPLTRAAVKLKTKIPAQLAARGTGRLVPFIGWGFLAYDIVDGITSKPQNSFLSHWPKFNFAQKKPGSLDPEQPVSENGEIGDFAQLPPDVVLPPPIPPGVIARIEAEQAVKNVEMALDPAALAVVIAGGVVAANPDVPAAVVSTVLQDVQDEEVVNEKARQAVLGADNTVIQNAEETLPSELSSNDNSLTKIYTEQGIYRIERDGDGRLVSKELVASFGERDIVDDVDLGTYADSLRGDSQKSTPRVASEYVSPSGGVYRAYAAEGLNMPNPLKRVLDEVTNITMDSRRGVCGEINALIKACNAEGIKAVRGGHMRSVFVKSLQSPTTKHGSVVDPCDLYCKTALEGLDITWDEMR
ncbi:LamG-like jellyroll fold domain-containing protein [Lentzea sp. BCCO 10_0798]|uniref:LamG-like jellyroll fold domain-containing protein n=1 Tax=Lentzea kristufekii TaxID=3095430 RepID=A0ABU4TJZ1_9PSEU|nr:LamG-like jellyroll fold domain-containing protein [Lentzea sp. BCCO 10_0798]MDX8048572.1 LamG-like jellyroll fold domain-containing protein [Lentzea sp. BCCO 10_0798]